MNFDENRYFFVSGLLSFSFFFFILGLIAYTVSHTVTNQQFGMVKSDVVSISINISDSLTPVVEATAQPTNEPLTDTKDETKNEEPDQSDISENEQQTVPNINDLFSDVKTVPSQPKKQKNTLNPDALNALEKEVTSSSHTSNLSEKVKSLPAAKYSVQMNVESGSSGPVVNEYHAKIQGLVYTNFHPPVGTEGQTSRVRIKISADGRLLMFKVISKSGNQPFDSEVSWLNERLAQVRFPNNPEQKDAVIELILKAREQ